MNDHCADRRRAVVPRLLAVLFGLLGLTLVQPAPAVARTVSPAAAEGATGSSGSTGGGTALPMRGRIAALCGTRAARRGAGGQAGVQAGVQAGGQAHGGGGTGVTGRAGADSAAIGARPPVVVPILAVPTLAEPPTALVPHVPAVRDAPADGMFSSGPRGVVTALGPPPHLSAVHGRAPPARAQAGGSVAA